MNQPRYDPSRDRQELGRLVAEFRRLIDGFGGGRDFAGYELILPGHLQRLSRRCGRTNCHCAHGQLHRSTVFVDRTNGVRKVRTLTIREYDLLQGPTLAFQALRRKRARLTKLFQEVLAICDRLTAFRAGRGRAKYRDLLEGK
jgi:hypothetical protein